MKLPKIFNFKKFTKSNGKLLPITFSNKFPIKVKRIFFIYGKKKYKRGDHAHKKCSQVFFAIKGKIKINMKYKNTNKSVFLDYNRSRALLVPPKIWSSIEFVKNQSVALVLTDYEYDFKDYIETYEEFIAFQKKNK
ncbi:MAG: FdtA/QdtA family cupin domain-containing protein [Candidatus Pelagibacter bacterium]|jgi:dTDP-4-dehydrorhamnose 3,5-epimerase-like enzyme|nr:FdtA/QdtA family cupin domain-containing protein [Candidatus Pelagibacter bacterium]